MFVFSSKSRQRKYVAVESWEQRTWPKQKIKEKEVKIKVDRREKPRGNGFQAIDVLLRVTVVCGGKNLWNH